MTTSRARSLQQQLRPWRWTLQAVGIGLAGVVLVVLVFASPTEAYCSSHSTGCGLVTGFISTTLIAVAGYFFIVVWTLRRAIPRYLDLARRTPHTLLPTAGRVRFADLVARPSLARAIINELEPSRRGAPVVVVGAAGAGKTSFLLELISRIAEHHAVPVACSLRAAEPPVRLRAMAHERFIEAIDPLVRSAEHAERIWRRLCADGEIVLVVDGLDEFMLGRPSHERDQVIRSALADARNNRLPVVIASRPETLPIGAHVSVFELDPLTKEDVVRYLEGRIPPRSRPDPAVLRDLADECRATPYYLDVIAALHRSGWIKADYGTNRDRLLVQLLDSWVALLLDGGVLGDVELDRARRTSIINGLGNLAFEMTTAATLDGRLEQIAGAQNRPAGGGQSLPVSAVVDGATRLELVEAFPLNGGTGVRFTHAIGQTYFLSRHLNSEPDAWQTLVGGAPTAEMNRALVMWCARDGDPEHAARVAEVLVSRAATLDPDRGLFLLVTAGEIASAAGLDQFRALEGAGVGRAWSRASPRARLAAVRRLKGRTDTWSLRALQDRTRDRDEAYRVRWAAAGAVALAGDAAWAVLGDEFEQTVRAAVSRTSTQWTDAETHDISVTAWILPALAPVLADGNRGAAEKLVEDLAALVPNMPPGTESSLAEGFKLDARTNPPGPIAPVLWQLLQRSTFWYARIMLVHAVCIRAIRDARANAGAAAELRKVTRNNPHPFVAAAVTLGERAMRDNDFMRWIWEDEIAAITGSGTTLDDDTTRLLADVVLLLNLTEQGDPTDRENREARKNETYRRAGLPYCLAHSRTRDELFEACPTRECPFDLCPYPSTADRALGRGQFSAAFCLHLAEISGRRASMRARLTARRGVRWSRLAGRDAGRFWERMADHGF